MRSLCAAVLCGLALPAAALARSDVVQVGAARFEVLTPTLLRLEYAQDRQFENRPTMTATRRRLPVPAFSVGRAHGWLQIRTSKLTLRYRLGSGPFASGNLSLAWRMGGPPATVAPSPAEAPGNLGGWRRALDLQDAPVTLNDGLLSRAGWYVLDDTHTALLTSSPPGFAVRPARTGAYQDWYLFAYGRALASGLEDLRALTGASPLLPRSAFGVWFSRYYPYAESDYPALLAQFRSNRVPLDTLSVDTDWKRESGSCCAQLAATIAGAPGKPYSWDGWEWDTSLFPSPPQFIQWAHSQGLSLTLNIHPSISTDDPQWPATNAAAGGLATPPTAMCRVLIADPAAQCGVFDWTQPSQIAAYFALHKPLEDEGIDFFWLDWCCDASSAVAPGLTADTWINSLYAQQEHQRGLRWLSFARAGASYNGDSVDGDDQAGGTGIFAEHRYTIQFTGDTCATWPMLGFEAQFSAEEGNVGLPYISDDIGSFNGQPQDGQCSAQTGVLNEHLPDDLYARWVAFGTFQPLDRLHSNHGDRLPWEYGTAANAAAAGFLRLREALGPYVYTLARRSYDTGLPLTGALYLQWPNIAAAYQHPTEYTFGPDVVVEPVTASGDPAPATLWVPPGTWVDYFTGARFTGPGVRTLSVPLNQMPVLVRAGTVIPTQPYVAYTQPAPAKSLVLTVFPGARGGFRLYDDAGVGFGYQHGRYAWTAITHHQRARLDTLTIAAARGSFSGLPRQRSWQLVFLGVRRPRVVEVGGRADRFSYDAATQTLTLDTGPRRTDRPVKITVAGAGRA